LSVIRVSKAVRDWAAQRRMRASLRASDHSSSLEPDRSQGILLLPAMPDGMSATINCPPLQSPFVNAGDELFSRSAVFLSPEGA